MVKLLAERTWLVTPRGPALFGFVHRTFLEYLCAFELVEHFKAQVVGLAELRDDYVLRRIGDDSWHEVIRLLVGQLPAAAASELVEAICPEVRTAVHTHTERLGLAWQCIAEIESGQLRNMPTTCNALLSSLYAWLAMTRRDAVPMALHDVPPPAQHDDVFPPAKYDDDDVPPPAERGVFFVAGQIAEAFSAIAPGSWPVPCLVRFGVPTPSTSIPMDIGASLARAIWRFEPNALQLLIKEARADPNLWGRGVALQALVAWWPGDPATKSLLLALAIDGDSYLRTIALRALAEHFTETPEVKPLLLARIKEPDAEIREIALNAVARHFREAPETKPLLMEQAREAPSRAARRDTQRVLAQYFLDASEVKLLLLSMLRNELHNSQSTYDAVLLLDHMDDSRGATLLSRDLDGKWPGSDLTTVIDDDRVRLAAKRLGTSEEEVRGDYERLAGQFGLALAWCSQEA